MGNFPLDKNIVNQIKIERNYFAHLDSGNKNAKINLKDKMKKATKRLKLAISDESLFLVEINHLKKPIRDLCNYMNE